MSKLLEAKALLIERGIARSGGLEDPNGCLCALGALNMAYTGGSGQSMDDEGFDLPYFPQDLDHLADVAALAAVVASRAPYLVREADNEVSYLVWRYNDISRHTDEDILSLFDEADAL